MCRVSDPHGSRNGRHRSATDPVAPTRVFSLCVDHFRTPGGKSSVALAQCRASEAVVNSIAAVTARKRLGSVVPGPIDSARKPWP